jgi:hypothetical protein
MCDAGLPWPGARFPHHSHRLEKAMSHEKYEEYQDCIAACHACAVACFRCEKECRKVAPTVA